MSFTRPQIHALMVRAASPQFRPEKAAQLSAKATKAATPAMPKMGRPGSLSVSSAGHVMKSSFGGQ